MIQEEKIETAVIIGAGPAGLTAAYELATNSDKKIIVLEATDAIGGISKTVDYKGNKIDIGGHRFFSKSDWVLNWWQQFMPISEKQHAFISTYQNNTKRILPKKNADPEAPKMEVRPRKSRIYYNNKLFDYPVKVNLKTLQGLGLAKSAKIAASLTRSKMQPFKKEENLEHFFINRFGKELYETFFKSYTQKVWGKPCTEISAEWGRQRVKSLSPKKILSHYFNTILFPSKQKFASDDVEQSLTEYFLYPPKGPGQLWEIVAEKCKEKGVEIRRNSCVEQVILDDNKVRKIRVKNQESKEDYQMEVDYLISSMPIKKLVDGITPPLPKSVKAVGTRLEYRDFLIVGILLDDLLLKEKDGSSIKDNWLYIQDKGLQVGRVQLFHNWSKDLVANQNNYWIGAEYFCNEGDELWEMEEQKMKALAVKELAKIGLIESNKVKDSVVVKMSKAYPSYIGAYNDFELVKEHLSNINNLYLMGRNGMHKYNNQDHSMLTAKTVVDMILEQSNDTQQLWEINTEQEYQEAKAVTQ